jgi:hypothetical protein
MSKVEQPAAEPALPWEPAAEGALVEPKERAGGSTGSQHWILKAMKAETGGSKEPPGSREAPSSSSFYPLARCHKPAEIFLALRTPAVPMGRPFKAFEAAVRLPW